MIVPARRTTVMRWPSANHHSASGSDTRLPRTPRGPVSMSLLAGVGRARHCFVAEREQYIGSDVEGRLAAFPQICAPLKGIFCDDISEIAVGTLITERPRSRVGSRRGSGFDDADVSSIPPIIPYGGFSPIRLQG
jgi:hypothetical protein